MKSNIYLVQVNNQYGNNVFLPYSVGLVQAYCQTIKEINENFNFGDFIYLRHQPGATARRLDHPKIVGISCYIWNWEWNKALARSIKAYYPDCVIVLGGPQVPIRSETFFYQHPYVDLLVHYEGEVGFSEILLESLNDLPDYTRLNGLSVRLGDNRCHQTLARERLTNLDGLPSPYLAGIFDPLMEAPYDFHASQETHRGCPYACTFCDWGSAVFTKVRSFSDTRLEMEFEWFGKNRIELLYNCDANYGLLRRDFALTEKLVATKQKFDFPKQFRAAYAKNSDEKIFKLAKVLNESQMSKGVTLSFQSLDPHTLDVIKRSNIKTADFAALMKMYHAAGIPTYTELIMGLPGETYDSFANGVDQLLEAGQHDGLNIYPCSVLPNSELADPSYVLEHGIRSVSMPMLLQHSSPAADAITEYNDIVVETKALTKEDYKKTFVFCWAVQSFHCLGLAQFLAVYLHSRFSLPYRAFLEELIEFAKANPKTLLGDEFQLVSDEVDKAVEGGGWGRLIPRFGKILWPTEEATFLNIICDKDRFYREIEDFIRGLLTARGWELEEGLLSDLLKYQKHMIIDPLTPDRFIIELQFKLHDYFEAHRQGIASKLVKERNLLTITADQTYSGDLELYAQHVVWYGRKSGRCRHKNVQQLPVLPATSALGHWPGP